MARNPPAYLGASLDLNNSGPLLNTQAIRTALRACLSRDNSHDVSRGAAHAIQTQTDRLFRVASDVASHERQDERIRSEQGRQEVVPKEKGSRIARTSSETCGTVVERYR